MATKSFTLDDVAKHNTRDDLWVCIDGKVFDLSGSFAQLLHPGGLPPLLDVAGKECTTEFYGLHRSSVLANPKFARLQIGVLEGHKPEGALRPAAVPYGEALGFWRKHSPYYTQSHDRFREALRAFYDREVAPDAVQWDEDGTRPSAELHKKLGEAGLIGAIIAAEARGPELLERWGVTLPSGMDPRDFDNFHGLVANEELIYGVRGCYGLKDGLIGGIGIGLPPVIKFGSEYLVENYARPCVLGEKRFCLAISEPYAGSDVQKIRTRAIKHADGSWRVSGVKKWITGGMMADFFTTLVKTEEHGFVMMLIERGDGSTVETKPIKTSYSGAAGTAYASGIAFCALVNARDLDASIVLFRQVTFDETVVPPENVIGELGMGFYQTMANFNIERWSMIVSGNRHSRMVLEECVKWAQQRNVFGKPLFTQPVIRFKIGQMIAEVETVHSASLLPAAARVAPDEAPRRSHPLSNRARRGQMLEDLTFQMNAMSEEEINAQLAGPIALLKYKQTRTATLVSDNACQVFGGRALTRTGMGQIIEKFQRSFKMQAILGGSEEIMLDFAVRQAMRASAKLAKEPGAVPARL